MRFNFVPKARSSVAGLLLCLAVLISGLVFAACGGSGGSSTGGGSGGGEDKGAVGMSFGGLEIELWDDVISLMKPEVEAAGYELLVDDPQFKVDKQVQDWEAWIARGNVKSIMGYPVQVDALIPVTERASEEGIPVLGYTQNWTGTEAALLTKPIPDGKRLGNDAGEWIKETFGNKPVDVAVISDESSEITKGRSEGLGEGVEEIAPNATVYDVPAFTRDEGFNAAKAQLTAHPETKVWIGFGDDAVQGAYRAVLDSGVAKNDPEYFFGSLDLTNESLDIMAIPNSIWRDGYVFTSKELAETNSEMLIEAAEGKEVEDHLIKATKVTPQNLDEFYVGERAEEVEKEGK